MRRSGNEDKFRAAFAAASLASLSALFFALLLVAAPSLHAYFHPDAAQAQHQCAVTALEAGNELSGLPLVIAAPQPAVQFSKLPALHSVWVAAPFLSASIFEHAPPALS